MHAKKLILSSLLAINFAPVLAYAGVSEVEIHNNTHATTITAQVGFFCSSHKSGGKLHAGETYTLSHSDLKELCGTETCNVRVFASSACDKREFAKVQIDAQNGITAVSNHNEEKFKIVNSSTYVELDDAPQDSGLKGFFNKLFGA